MVYSFVIALVIYLLFRYAPKLKELEVDGFMSVAFVLIPGIIGWGIGLALPELFIAQLGVLLLYLLVPTFILKKSYNLSWGKALQYGGIVLLVVVVCQVIFAVIFGQF